MRIAILETGRVPEEVRAEFGSYPDLMRRWLGPVLPEARFEDIPVVDGELPSEPAAYDGYVITGSRHGVYDDLDWLPPLKGFIARTAKADVPQVGICFGHQVAAEALGGHARKADQGWGIGRQQYLIDLGDEKDAIDVLVFHQDQVVEVPPTARVIGGNDFCPNGAFVYAEPLVTVQFHPEFEIDFVTRLLDVREEVTVPLDVSKQARASMIRPPENQRVAKWAARFLRGKVEA